MINQTVYDSSGKILLYSEDDFYNQIVEGDNCFICGAERSTKIFNDEHILPQWILSKQNLYNKFINLPNSAQFLYGRYIIPCCKDCNSLLSVKLEDPLSKLFKLPYTDFCNVMKDINNRKLLYTWLSLIFFKTHLKDSTFNKNLDTRRGKGKISDGYDWVDLHHIHCIIRHDYTSAILDDSAIGSIIICPALIDDSMGTFDYADNYGGNSIMIRLDEICIICAIDDCGCAYSLMKDTFSKISGPLTPPQIRELFSILAFLNLNLKERPEFYSQILSNGDYHIGARFPKIVELLDESEIVVTLGELLCHYSKEGINRMKNLSELDKTQYLDEIKNEKRVFLFDGNGDFINFQNLIIKK